MLQVKDTYSEEVAHFDGLADLCSTYEEFKVELDSQSKTADELESELNGGGVIRNIVIDARCPDSRNPNRFIVTQIGEDVVPGTPELDESYLLLRLSEKDVQQVLHFYGLEDLEVSIKGDPTIKHVDGYEIMEMGGGCQVEIRGWLTHTQEWHIVHKTLIKGTIEETIQDIAHAKKGRVNHFAFL